MAGIFPWSTTAGSNSTVNGTSIAEGMAAANVNDAIRGLMALVRATFTDALESFFAGTAPLPIANGGTASTTGPAALTALGGLESTYRDMPVTTKTGAFTLADVDRGTCLRYTGAAAAATINPFGTTPINVGGVIRVRVAHNATGALTLTRGAGVSLRIAGQTADANVSVAVGGDCFLTHEATNLWVVSGAGIS